MSRNIVESGKHIWRYRAGQETPHAFISLIHDIGKYTILAFNEESELAEYTADEFMFEMNKTIADAYQDVLTIEKEDFAKLKKLLKDNEDKFKEQSDKFIKEFKDAEEYVDSNVLEKDMEYISKECPDIWFYKMVESIIRHMEANPRDKYHFIGEV